MYLKLIVLSVVLCSVYGQYYIASPTNSYELPYNDVNKSLNITITSAVELFQITIECYNYDSLKFFEIGLNDSEGFQLRNGIILDFKECFNNATDYGNYNYSLNKWFNSLPYFKAQYITGYPFTIKLDNYAEVNTDVLFGYFDFGKFNYVTFINVGFGSSKFLNVLYCRSCTFQNTGRINFNEFRDNITDATWLLISSTKLFNFTPANLKKFVALTLLSISDFDVDDYNALNTPGLFEHSVHMEEIILEGSKGKITLHEQVFRGLKNIRRIHLRKLQLDFIPTELFKDLVELYSVDLSTNNIKTVDPSIFQTNTRLTFISFPNNPFYTEPNDKLETFSLGGRLTKLYLGNFTTHTFDLLEQLIKVDHSTTVSFQSFLIDNFNFTDFTNIQSQRATTLHITFESGTPGLDLDYLKSLGNIIRSKYDIKDKLNTHILVNFAGDSMCHDCTMIKYLFPHYLKHYRDHPGFYFNESRLFVEFVIPSSCKNFEDQLDKIFTENCPGICDCTFNSLTEKVKINCNNKNLTEIPHIPYPQQYDKVHSIDLNFENNSISGLTSANQDSNVLKRVVSLNLKNNNIEFFSTNQTDLLSSIWALNICGNPALANENEYLRHRLASGFKHMNKNYCNVNGEAQRVVDFIRDNKACEIKEFLNGMECKQ